MSSVRSRSGTVALRRGAQASVRMCVSVCECVNVRARKNVHWHGMCVHVCGWATCVGLCA